jgi:hypothetical protein
LRQQQLDAQRAGLLQAQQAPLAQYNALMPFMQMVPQGAQQTSNDLHAAAVCFAGWCRNWFSGAWRDRKLYEPDHWV